MGLLDRVATLVRANLNDLIDKAEDPEVMLKQVILDMQNQLMQVKTQVAVAIADEHLLRRKVAGAQSAETEYVKKAESAMEKGREELARASAERAVSQRYLAATLAEQLADQSAQVERLKTALTKLEGKLAEARTKSDVLTARRRRARALSRATEARAAAVGDSHSATFDRMKEKVEREDALSAAKAELERDTVDDELTSLGREEEVNRMLEEIRTKKQSA